MVLNFTANEERGYDRHERNGSARIVAELFPPKEFKELMNLFVKVGKNPLLSQFNKLFHQMIRNLVEVVSFPDNISIFIDMAESCTKQLNSLTDNQLGKLEAFDFTPSQEAAVEQKEAIEEKKEVPLAQPETYERSAFDDEEVMQQPDQQVVHEIITEAQRAIEK